MTPGSKGGLGELHELFGQGVQRIPDPLTASFLAKECVREERLLRLQYMKDGELPTEAKLPPEWEHALQHPRRQPTTMSGALARWSFLTHCYRVRTERLTKADAGDAEDVLGKMLRREPVRIAVANRTVEVTGRSYNALLEIARHSLRMQECEHEIQRCAAVETRLTEIADGSATRRRRKAVSRRLRRLSALHRRLVLEMQLHRRAIYAHAFTPDGAPASSIAEAPDWFGAVTLEEDRRVLEAMFRVGHGRLDRLREALPEKDDEKKGAGFGFHSIFQTLVPKLNLRPADAYDRDLFQMLAFAHASAPQWEDFE